MIERPLLTPYAFTTVERAIDYMKRGMSIEVSGPDWLAVMITAVTGKFEGLTARRLAARTYRNPTTINCTATIKTRGLTAAAGFNALKTLDDAVGSTLDFGTRVDSITSDVALVLSRDALVSGLAAITFGSEPLVIDGDGTGDIQIPEYPLAGIADVYSVKEVATDGSKTSLDLTGARLERNTGRLHMPAAIACKGTQNIEIECKAGYRKPSVTAQGDWAAWGELEGLTLRLVQVMYQDWLGAVGRTGDISMVQLTQHITSFRLPDDIREGLADYVRLW